MANEDGPISKNYFQWKLEFDIYEDDVTEMTDLFSVEIVMYMPARFPARRTSQASSAVPDRHSFPQGSLG